MKTEILSTYPGKGNLQEPAFRKKLFVVFSLLMFIFHGCVSEFIPVVEEQEELLVVEGLVTDQLKSYTINLSKSLPLGKKSEAKPLGNCHVRISDDQGNSFELTETKTGRYVSDSTQFRGVVGRTYTLEIALNKYGNFDYRSEPMTMLPVPPIDSVYYEKIQLKDSIEVYPKGVDACRIYVDTHDPENECRYYRWDFRETWILLLLWPVDNAKCWVSENSASINLKSTAAFTESVVLRQPVHYIDNQSDRLSRRYSILVNQYSLSPEEFLFWDKLQNITDQTGGLYDIVPSSIPSNIRGLDNPDEKVLGYFSVSAVQSKRLFIPNEFGGLVNLYPNCPADTVWNEIYTDDLPDVYWTLAFEQLAFGATRRILTTDRGCADCTVRGTNKKPDFWIDE
jgi:hypothetical protein